MAQRYYNLVTHNNDRTADLYIFGDIVDAFITGLREEWGEDLGETSGLSIAKDLQGLDVDQIIVHINSMGGYTAEGLAIYNLLRNHKAKIKTIVDGFACSAASIVFMAGEERVMNDASLLMVHNAWSTACGNAAELRQQADDLEKISKAAANAYADKIKISREELDDLLDGTNHEGTWITPEEALEMGFATEIRKQDDGGAVNQSAMKTLMKAVRRPDPKYNLPLTVEVDMTAANKSLDDLKAKTESLNEMIQMITTAAAAARDAPGPESTPSLAQQLFNMAHNNIN